MNNFLPIGSVVILKDGCKKIMIYGRLQYQLINSNKLWDYVGCLYPEGYISDDYNIFFNQDEIQKIIYLGYEDTEELDFQNKITQFQKYI